MIKQHGTELDELEKTVRDMTSEIKRELIHDLRLEDPEIDETKLSYEVNDNFKSNLRLTQELDFLIKKNDFSLITIDYENTEMNTFLAHENRRQFWTLYLLVTPLVKATLNTIFGVHNSHLYKTLYKEKGYIPGYTTEWDHLFIIRLNKNSYYYDAIVNNRLPIFLQAYHILLYKMAELNILDIRKGIRLLGKKSKGKKARGKKARGRKSRGKK